ncbi:hypothetical protein GcM3_192018 [Golovinomyces cichoracearum]|uniref:Uncharacterized protein n=1 Tax=Golovinomyces cichoracearum TaxID=62708 RepID=A0A420HHH8_9PEZI|nr:hypothetical protein GcM3_192018 [Golovinomyces cichoracearum]
MVSEIDQVRSISELLEEICLTNPFEFEPDPLYNPNPTERKSSNIPSRYLSQVSKSTSKINTDLNYENCSPVYPPPGQNLYPVLRSESSPNILSQGFLRNEYKRPSIENLYDCMGNDVKSPNLRESLTSLPPINNFQNERGESSSYFSHYNYSSPSTSRSESPNLMMKEKISSKSRNSKPQRPVSPISMLDDVLELHESNYRTQSTKLKRSRSTTKKMFGEKGWLGVSPDEALKSGKSEPEKYSRLREKTSMMNKLRNKLGELAEKADLNSIPSSRMQRESRQGKISILSVSLGPAEQAGIFMEVELMTAYTANSFLMSNFSQGRMSIDSIKRTVDSWRSKGRPVVIEFMYDQVTQHDLIALNHDNLRFHGRHAKDNPRINTMLHNWKQVARIMAVRTFCCADSIILKMLFDIEQVLEFLGASDPIIFRLQQIRDSTLGMIKNSYQKEYDV